ncbi:MAG: hypothetical protein OXE77_10280 [Flavobacteriaceae bacterium]|nr:hypothetical protein [Flavobacteriaceae bacterium]MCY4266774.1 hypothetical protein [Flavobacteriaceae bacterium]
MNNKLINNTLSQKPKPSTYQPNAKELKEEHDMPRLSDEEIRETFFKPVR